MTTIISPSILSADFARLGDEVKAVLAAGADWIHFDVMDNHYVPNLTIGPLVCEALRKAGVDAPIDVHLMISPVDQLVPEFAKAGASYISFHPEATQHVDRTIQLIRDSGCKPGLVFNPATPLNWLDYVIDKIDLVLLMSVNPGFGGQKFIPQALPKLAEARARIDAAKRDIRLEIDGGVKVDNIGAIARAGADRFVAGSAIFGSGDYAKTIAAMRGRSRVFMVGIGSAPNTFLMTRAAEIVAGRSLPSFDQPVRSHSRTEESPPPENSARPRATAPLSSACQEVSQCERGACSEPIDATTTSAPRLAELKETASLATMR